MAFLTNDQVGSLAELIAAEELSRPVTGCYRRPLFRAAPLGDKYPTVDFLVDALGRNAVSRGFFFVQVKGTGTAPMAGIRLPVDVSQERFNLLVRLPAPTYLIGVDVGANASYLAAAHRPRTARVSSITKAYDLRGEDVKIELYKEVLAFWKANKPTRWKTKFKDV